MPKRNGLLFTFGLNVRRAREAKELTQEKLAERASLDPTYISGIERGLRNPGIKRFSELPALSARESYKMSSIVTALCLKNSISVILNKFELWRGSFGRDFETVPFVRKEVFSDRL